MRLLIPPGVFRPISDSWMLAEVFAAHARPGARMLELCSGAGAAAIAAARRGAEVTAVDVGRRAVITTALNARLNGTRVRALRGDLFAPVAGERFSAIAVNPPYVPSNAVPDRGPQRAWEAGRGGRAVLDRIIAAAPAHLDRGGVLLLVHSDLIGERRTLDALRAAGLRGDVLLRRRGPLGPRMRKLLGPTGQDEEEELLVFAAHNDGGRESLPAAGGLEKHGPP